MNLKKRREDANLTQSTLATMMEVSQSTISRYEENPENIPFGEMIKLARALGVNPAELIDEASPPLVTGLDPGNPYQRLLRELSLLREFATSAPFKPAELPDGSPTTAQLLALADVVGRKPNLALTGKFDGAKSTLANVLLGSESLPTAYQPATRVVTYIRHLEDRPSWMKEAVWMLSEGFNATQWSDLEHCQTHRVVAGNLETLRDYGTHEGQHGKNSAAAYALVFIDAHILRACNIIDLPGFDNDTEDTSRAKANPIQADAAIYVNPFVGFMAGADILRVGQLVRELPHLELLDPSFPVLGNLFIVATHAGPQIMEGDISKALDRAAERTWSILGETSLGERARTSGRLIDQAVLRGRFFTFYREMPSRRENLEQELGELMSTLLPNVWRQRADKEILGFKSRSKDQLAATLDAYLQMVNDIKQVEEELEGLRAERPSRKRRMKEARDHVATKIRTYKSRSLEALHRDYGSLVDADAIERIIRSRYQNKKEAQQYAAAFVFEQLQHRVERQTGELAEELTKDIEQFLDHYREARLKFGTDRDSVSIPFNVEGAFIGGLAGAAGVGALAAWAATLGNLGAYIIAAKLVSLLSALGISISGGTAAVMAFIATIGGPITIAVGIVALAALAGWALFGASWQRRLAKKIVGTMAEKNVLGQFREQLGKYWDETGDAFSKGADEVEHQFNDYLRDLEELVSQRTAGKGEIERRLARLEVARDFFAGIPWLAVERAIGQQ